MQPASDEPLYRLFSWEHSYFSGKVRAYLRFKHRQAALGTGYEDILATPELIEGYLLPRSGSGAVPQLQAPDGTWIQDSSEIIDYCEAAHPESSIIPDPESRPRQCLVAYLIELLADEWMVVPGFWERWYFSEEGHSLNHRGFNEQQWGAVLAAGALGDVRRATGAGFFEAAFGISDTRNKPKGVYAGLVQLGVDEHTEKAWQASQHRLLGRLEAHFSQHDYLLGGTPSLADFGLLGPLYAHLYRDAVSGFALRTHFPLVCEWVERTNGEGALNARMVGQKIYGLDEDGNLVGRTATSDAGQWLPDDEIPETLLPILEVFFEEMWPVLESSAAVLTRYIQSDAHKPGGELPGKTFTATPGFEALQTDEGALTHSFAIGDVTGRRMVIPYQIWMLQRIEPVLAKAVATASGRKSVESLVDRFPRGSELLRLGDLLKGCRVRKEGALLYSV
ncbi:MAG: glutathione S-transferase family protein [Deltaproteobacteria bacterium]|nr:glutathione S-transferase family protein [Deltaproteobacteria bacterium]MBW2723909.1 glutathione S-transferase family protein [Deltaproteobacteria bacterium]